MHATYVWVPGKGWKEVYFGPSIEKAAALFDALQPLEVMQLGPSGFKREAGVEHKMANSCPGRGRNEHSYIEAAPSVPNPPR